MIELPDLTNTTWQQSSFCNGGDSNCVQIAFVADSVLLRDSKDVAQPPLAFSHEEWAAFRAGVAADEF